MTIWFAQASNVNIDSANLWNDAANGSGNFLTFANLGASDILVANGRTGIVINVDFTCLRITTSNADGGTAGGGFTLGAGRMITCNVIAGTTTCLTRTAVGAESFVVGNVFGSNTNNTTYGINHLSASLIHVVGNVFAGTATNGWGIAVLGGGQLIITGSTFGASSGLAGRAVGVQATGGAILTINGNVNAGAGNQANGIFALTSCLCIINGNVSSAGAGGIDIQSNACSIRLTGDLQSSQHVPAITSNTIYALFHAGNIITGANSLHPFGLVLFRPHPTTQMQHQFRSYNAINFSELGDRTLFTSGVNIGLPIESDVRFGIIYGGEQERTGALRVPDPQYVNAGVLVDDTVGTLQVDLQPVIDLQPVMDIVNPLLESVNDVLSIESSPNLLSNPVWENYVFDGNLSFNKENLLISSRSNAYAIRRIQTKFFNIATCIIKQKTDQDLTWGPAIAIQNSSQTLKIGTRGLNKVAVYVNGILSEFPYAHDPFEGVQVRLVADRKNILAQVFNISLNRWVSLGQIPDLDATSYVLSLGKSDQLGNATNWPQLGSVVESEITNFLFNNFNSCR